MMALTSARTSACSKGVRSEGFAASIHGASASRIDSSQDDHRRHLLGQERHQSGSAYPTSAHSLRDPPGTEVPSAAYRSSGSRGGLLEKWPGEIRPEWQLSPQRAHQVLARSLTAARGLSRSTSCPTRPRATADVRAPSARFICWWISSGLDAAFLWNQIDDHDGDRGRRVLRSVRWLRKLPKPFAEQLRHYGRRAGTRLDQMFSSAHRLNCWIGLRRV